MKISYNLSYFENEERMDIPLKSKTDLGARREASKIAKENSITGYRISFFRTSDGCSGTISP